MMRLVLLLKYLMTITESDVRPDLLQKGVKDHHDELGFWLENKNAARGTLRTD